MNTRGDLTPVTSPPREVLNLPDKTTYSNLRIHRYIQFITLFVSLFYCAFGYGQAQKGKTVIDTLYRDTLYTKSLVREAGSPMRLSLGGGYGVNLYSNDPLPIPLATGCDTFLSASTPGFSINAGLLIPLAEKNELFVSPFLSFRDLKGESRYGQFFTDIVNGERQGLEFEHTITAYTKSIGLGAVIDWQVMDRVYLGLGAEAAALFSQTYDKILRPTGPGGFEGGARDSLESEGDLPNAHSFMPSVMFSLLGEFPLSKRLFASPGVSYVLPLSGTTDYFRLTSLQGTLSFYYNFSSNADTTIERIRDSIPYYVSRFIPDTPRSKLSVSIDAFGKNREGEEERVIRIDVVDVKARVAFPFLNYIFFDEGSSFIPVRYLTYKTPEEANQRFKGLTERNSEKLLNLYHEVLNVLGSRMRSLPQSKITLTGSTSNTGQETNNTSLARKRAQVVKDYLVSIWKIEPERINVEARVLPLRPSPQTTKQGQEENRRVEITSNDDRLTDPIIVTNTEHIATPSDLILRPRFAGDTGIQRVITEMRIGNNVIDKYDGDVTGFLNRKSSWSLTDDALSLQNDSLTLFLEATDSLGTVASAINTIPLKRTRSEREREQELERYSLILFGFDEDALGAKNERTLNIVAESFKKMKPEIVNVLGYTDETGDQSYNDELSRRRAEKAIKQLEVSLKQKKVTLPAKTFVEGKGSREVLYDNTLPEGRFFSRTVNITLGKSK
jgi:outer membrane protein OmpA-like peptidoglycan-associated protein